MRSTILKLLSHKNNKGDTVIIEAMKQDRSDLLESLRITNLVKPDPERERQVSLGFFFKRYEEVMARIEQRRKKKRWWVFWENEEDDEPEESRGLIQL